MVRYLFYTIGDLTYQSPLVWLMTGTSWELLVARLSHKMWGVLLNRWGRFIFSRRTVFRGVVD